MCSYIYAPFLPNFSLGVLNPHVLVCRFLLYWPGSFLRFIDLDKELGQYTASAILTWHLVNIKHLFFSKLASGWNPPNPTIWLVPRTGSFLRSCPLTRAESLAAHMCCKQIFVFSPLLWSKLTVWSEMFCGVFNFNKVKCLSILAGEKCRCLD